MYLHNIHIASQYHVPSTNSNSSNTSIAVVPCNSSIYIQDSIAAVPCNSNIAAVPYNSSITSIPAATSIAAYIFKIAYNRTYHASNTMLISYIEDKNSTKTRPLGSDYIKGERES
jgi:hypothetical protein